MDRVLVFETRNASSTLAVPTNRVSKCMTFADYYYNLISESLTAEKQLFDDPKTEFYLDITPEDDNEGVISYKDQEIPVSKRGAGGHIEYIVGSVATGKTFTGNTPNAFLKIKQAVMNGEIAQTSKANPFRSVEREIPATVKVMMGDGKEKEYVYVAPGEVDNLVTHLYKTFGNEYTNYVKQYATDRQNARSDNPYIPISQIARQNVFRHRLGPKDGAINYRTR